VVVVAVVCVGLVVGGVLSEVLSTDDVGWAAGAEQATRPATTPTNSECRTIEP